MSGNFFSGLAEGLAGGQAAASKERMEQQRLQMDQQEFDLKKRAYDKQEQEAEQQMKLKQGLNQAFSEGGYEGAMDYIKHEDMATYMEISKAKASMDKSIADAATSQYASEKNRQETILSAHTILGRFGASLLKVPAEERSQAYQSMLPVMRKIYPDMPEEYDDKAQNVLLMSMGVSMPDSVLYASQKKTARAQTQIGKIEADIRNLRENGASEDDESLKALKAQLQAEISNSTDAQLDAAKNAKGEDALRAQYLNYTKNFTVIRDQFKQTQTLEAKLKDPTYSPSSVDDMGLIYNVMKSKSPESTVMPGEYATGEKAGGWDDKSIVAYNKALKGQLLSPKVREQYINSMHELYNAQESSYRQFRDGITGIATRRGLDPKNIVIDLGADNSQQQQSSIPESWKQQVKVLNPDYSDADIAAAWEYTQKQQGAKMSASQQAAPQGVVQQQEPIGEGNPPWQANNRSMW